MLRFSSKKTSSNVFTFEITNEEALAIYVLYRLKDYSYQNRNKRVFAKQTGNSLSR